MTSFMDDPLAGFLHDIQFCVVIQFNLQLFPFYLENHENADKKNLKNLIRSVHKLCNADFQILIVPPLPFCYSKPNEI